MSNIKVVDINNEEVKQEEAIEQPNEEVKEEVVNEVVEEPPQETANGSLNSNSVEVETNEVIEEVKEEPKQETTKVKAQDKMVRCPKCNKEMKYKKFRYGHQQKCQGGIENKPVKPHTKARAKPIIKQVEVNEHGSSEARDLRDPQETPKQTIQQQIPQQQSQPSNPLADITNHYQLLQNQFIQQKKEKYNNLCQSMFAPKSKKR